MSIRIILYLLLFCFLMSPEVLAGDIKKIRGEAEVFSAETESPEEARRRAVQKARIDALDKAFGTAIIDRTINISDTRDGQTSNTTRSVGESLVNGDWLGDITEPEFRVVPVEYGHMYYVKVYGEARQKKSNLADLDCRLLCNGVDPDKDRLRGNIFYEGDELYLYFLAPVDGWLSIFLVDDDDQHTTQCLVPYDEQTDAAYPIVANREYVFFSKLTAEPQYVDNVTRMILESRKKMDINELYIIFSPNKYTKPTSTVYKHSRHDTDEEEIQADLMPRETTFLKFDKWLCKQRRRDADLQQIPITFSISKK